VPDLHEFCVGGSRGGFVADGGGGLGKPLQRLGTPRCELQRSLDLPAEGLVPLRELFRASTLPAKRARPRR